VMSRDEVVQNLAALELPNAAIVDSTASPDIVAAYPDYVKANMHIITPNKVANVLDWAHYESLMQLMRSRQKHFLYEANVGAGLPVISTLKDLIASGDTIIQIEGILSGTLSYLFNNYDGTIPFSKLVEKAHSLGFTEPDPREDLSGQDVARKLLILARQLGSRLDLKDISVESLVPKQLRSGNLPKDFYAKLSSSDEAIHRRYLDARARKRVLRFVGTLRDGKGTAGLKQFPLGHPFAGAQGSDNIITFTTKRYSHTPMVVQGPGAGADVTAMGVFSDILKLLHYLPY
jgi:aspartokinase/homoserine dehydrogenase 1